MSAGRFQAMDGLRRRARFDASRAELAKRLGERLRGARLAEYVLIGAADGYRVVFVLPELDPAFADRVVLLADRRNGQPLSTDEAPFMVVVPGEKRHSRWIRQVIDKP